MFYKHNLKYLGVSYSFPDVLDDQQVSDWCDAVRKPSPELLDSLNKVNLKEMYHRANSFMVDTSKSVNDLFSKEFDSFLKDETHNKTDVKYFDEFLRAHFKHERHVRVLVVQLIGNFLLNSQRQEEGLKDDLKVRKLINDDQYKTWAKTLDLLSVATEVLNTASYSADDVFDRTESRYQVPTVFKSQGGFAGTIGADILFHYLGNYFFYKTIREHEKGAEDAYLGDGKNISTNENPYSLKWEDKGSKNYVYINPEQWMDVWEVWTWAWYMINSGQIRDLHEFSYKNIENFNIKKYASRVYRLGGGFIECASHLTTAFMGCGYWKGRQNVGKWAAIYGMTLQARNDFYDYVTYTITGSAHKIMKDTHEDTSLGRITLPLGYAYTKASNSDQLKMVALIKNIVSKKENNEDIVFEDKINLNILISKNGGFIAAKKFVYNSTLWALEELLKLENDFQKDDHYWELVAWTMASLNIVNLSPESDIEQKKLVKNLFDIEEIYEYLNDLDIG